MCTQTCTFSVITQMAAPCKKQYLMKERDVNIFNLIT